MEEDLRHTYSVTGAMHVLAVSGLHVGLIYGMISWLMSWWPGYAWARNVKVVLILVILTGYAALAGFTPSVVRAVVFLSLLLISSLLNRPNPLPHVLFLTAFLMLLYHPFHLFQPSFQLSFMAVLGIVIFMPLLEPIFSHRWKILDFMGKNIALSISVQLTTLFITVTYFHQLSLSFWASSILVVPGAFLLLLAGISLFIFSGVPSLQAWVIKGTGLIIDVLHTALRWIESLPYSHIAQFYLPPWLLILLPVMVYLAWTSFNIKKVSFFRMSLVLLLFWWSGLVHHQSRVQQNSAAAIFIRKGSWMLTHIDQGVGRLWYPGRKEPDEVWMTFSVRPWFTLQGIREVTENVLPAVSTMGVTIKIDSSSVVFSAKTDNFQQVKMDRPLLLLLLRGEEVDTLEIDLRQPGMHELNL